MSGPDPAKLRAEARRWLLRAEDDLAVIALVLAASPPRAAPAAFHAQQAAEKLLKALLVLAGRPVPRTHDVQRLLGLVGPLPGFSEPEREMLGSLTVWAGTGRYPDVTDSGNPEAEDVALALPVIEGLAAHVRAATAAC